MHQRFSTDHILELRTLGGLTTPIDRFSNPAQNPYNDPSMLESEADKSFSQSTLQQASMKRTYHSNDTAIEQREREINDIAKGIIELADIFKNLQAMVIDQGTMLDRIDYNVEKMSVDVKGAQKELVTVSTLKPTAGDTHACPIGNQLPAQIYQTQDLVPTSASSYRHVHTTSCQAQAARSNGAGIARSATSCAYQRWRHCKTA